MSISKKRNVENERKLQDENNLQKNPSVIEYVENSKEEIETNTKKKIIKLKNEKIEDYFIIQNVLPVCEEYLMNHMNSKHKEETNTDRITEVAEKNQHMEDKAKGCTKELNNTKTEMISYDTSNELISMNSKDEIENMKQKSEKKLYIRTDLKNFQLPNERPILMYVVDKQNKSEKIMKVLSKKKVLSAFGDKWEETIEYIISLKGHNNIMKIYNVYDDGKHFYMIVEKLNGTELFAFLVYGRQVNEYIGKYIVTQILEAVNYLHEHSLIHRDIKPENLMFRHKKQKDKDIEYNYQVVLIDFDTCYKIEEGDLYNISEEYKEYHKNPEYMDLKRIMNVPFYVHKMRQHISMDYSRWLKTTKKIQKQDEGSTLVVYRKQNKPKINTMFCLKKRKSNKLIGTYGYMAPEIVKGYDYTSISDMWAIGVVCFIILTSATPLPMCIMVNMKATAETLDRAKKNGINFNVPFFQEHPLAKDLCQQLLQFDPLNRIPTAAIALTHPWLKQFNERKKNCTLGNILMQNFQDIQANSISGVREDIKCVKDESDKEETNIETTIDIRPMKISEMNKTMASTFQSISNFPMIDTVMCDKIKKEVIESILTEKSMNLNFMVPTNALMNGSNIYEKALLEPRKTCREGVQGILLHDTYDKINEVLKNKYIVNQWGEYEEIISNSDKINNKLEKNKIYKENSTEDVYHKYEASSMIMHKLIEEEKKHKQYIEQVMHTSAIVNQYLNSYNQHYFYNMNETNLYNNTENTTNIDFHRFLKELLSSKNPEMPMEPKNNIHGTNILVLPLKGISDSCSYQILREEPEGIMNRKNKKRHTVREELKELNETNHEQIRNDSQYSFHNTFSSIQSNHYIQNVTTYGNTNPYLQNPEGAGVLKSMDPFYTFEIRSPESTDIIRYTSNTKRTSPSKNYINGTSSKSTNDLNSLNPINTNSSDSTIISAFMHNERNLFNENVLGNTTGTEPSIPNTLNNNNYLKMYNQLLNNNNAETYVNLSSNTRSCDSLLRTEINPPEFILNESSGTNVTNYSPNIISRNLKNSINPSYNKVIHSNEYNRKHQNLKNSAYVHVKALHPSSNEMDINHEMKKNRKRKGDNLFI